MIWKWISKNKAQQIVLPSSVLKSLKAILSIQYYNLLFYHTWEINDMQQSIEWNNIE